MSEFTESEIERMHTELAFLYENKSTDVVRISGIWARIERLEAALVKEKARDERMAGQ